MYSRAARAAATSSADSGGRAAGARLQALRVVLGARQVRLILVAAVLIAAALDWGVASGLAGNARGGGRGRGIVVLEEAGREPHAEPDQQSGDDEGGGANSKPVHTSNMATAFRNLRESRTRRSVPRAA